MVHVTMSTLSELRGVVDASSVSDLALTCDCGTSGIAIAVTDWAVFLLFLAILQWEKLTFSE